MTSFDLSGIDFQRLDKPFDVALATMRAFHEDFPDRFYGTTLHDAALPVVDTWDADNEVHRFFVFYDNGRRDEALMRAWWRTAGRDDADKAFPCGYVAAIVNEHGEYYELTEADEAREAERERVRQARRKSLICE